MKISISKVEGRVPVTVIQVEGRVNMGNAHELRGQATAAINQGADHIVLDLSGVESLTSEGLRTIHGIYNALLSADEREKQEQGQLVQSATFKLANPNADIRRVLEISGFSAFIEIHDSLQAAVDAI